MEDVEVAVAVETVDAIVLVRFVVGFVGSVMVTFVVVAVVVVSWISLSAMLCLSSVLLIMTLCL